MRTLLNEALPPHFDDEPAFSFSQKIQRLRRIFSENPVLSNTGPMEVGADRTVIATPGAQAAPERGSTISSAGVEHFNDSPAL